ncbi:hypothetical protein AB6T85_21185 [Erwinia sp. ACCC 02193]|uniref:Uncharacterized protein n=1 Tax=Erwinia aeris TaxID=3239803 RepID=A0ABV4EDB2_9GAMM
MMLVPEGEVKWCTAFFSLSLSRPNLVWGCCEFIVNEHKREIAKSKVVCCFKKMSVFASFNGIFLRLLAFVFHFMLQFVNNTRAGIAGKCYKHQVCAEKRGSLRRSRFVAGLGGPLYIQSEHRCEPQRVGQCRLRRVCNINALRLGEVIYDVI